MLSVWSVPTSFFNLFAEKQFNICQKNLGKIANSKLSIGLRDIKFVGGILIQKIVVEGGTTQEVT